MSTTEASHGDSNISTFLRIRPSKGRAKCFSQDEKDPKRLRFHVPNEAKSFEVINNSKTDFEFTFSGIFGEQCKQDDVFENVGAEAVRNVLNGYNSTIFAYGQTGSGKTFTITGGAERYCDRGIIPRSLNMLYTTFKERSDFQFLCYVSYLEIYNEQGYDLLNPKHSSVKSLDDLPKVLLQEDDFGNIHLKNLAMYASPSEEDALNYLFIGDTNRAISETSMNKASSRSHCIFTVSLEGRKLGGDTIMKSKLHLVDLAGSERVHKTNAVGQVLNEAKYINSSLFFLEMVIVALHEKSKGRRHIPYRNSLMTSVLRDSLGGNCKTIMIATINAEVAHVDESISTCRFAQRVSLIRNAAVVNEVVDPELVIQKLKFEIELLKEELSFFKNGAEETAELTSSEINVLQKKCEEYVENSQPDMSIGSLTVERVRACFRFLKGLVQQARAKPAENQCSGRCEQTIDEKNAEIKILVDMVKKGTHPEEILCWRGIRACYAEEPAEDKKSNLPKTEYELKWADVPFPAQHAFESDQMLYDHFCLHYAPRKAIEENKVLLQEKYAEAKRVGARVNQARSSINYLKKMIEQIRRERAIDGLMGDPKGALEFQANDPEEEQLKSAIEVEKEAYKSGYEELRRLKSEIERTQQLIQRGTVAMQQNYERWYDSVSAMQWTSERALGKEKNSEREASNAAAENSTNGQKAQTNGISCRAEDDVRAFHKASEELNMLRARKFN